MIENRKIIIHAVASAVLASALSFTAYHEGLRFSAYIDANRTATICYGHTQGVVMGQRLTKKECDILLKNELTLAFNEVDRNISVTLTDKQRIAFADFVYNVGEPAFKKSTMLKLINRNEMVAACNQLPRWIYGGGKILPGLKKRREDERQLCLGGSIVNGT